MEEQKNQKRHAIKLAARRAGVSVHVIRAWERRYGAIDPLRTPTNRRLYSDADIERLSLLHAATQAGHTISQITGLPLDQLREMAGVAPPPRPFNAETFRPPATPDGLDYKDLLPRCAEAIQRLDAPEMVSLLTRARLELPPQAVIDHLLIPLLTHIGEAWESGHIRVAHEHMASATIRNYLGERLSTLTVPREAPRLIATTPAGQLHEFGALLVTLTALEEGWRAMYLGPNTPAEEVAAAARQQGPCVVALSLVYPPDDPQVVTELQLLGRLLTTEQPLIIGGRAAATYHPMLAVTGARLLPDLAALRQELRRLRTGPEAGI